jgi:protein subunit release factor A
MHHGRVDIADGDLRFDVIRVGAGGPCVVRVTHLPTGTSATVDDQPSIPESRKLAYERLVALLAE